MSACHARHVLKTRSQLVYRSPLLHTHTVTHPTALFCFYQTIVCFNIVKQDDTPVKTESRGEYVHRRGILTRFTFCLSIRSLPWSLIYIKKTPKPQQRYKYINQPLASLIVQRHHFIQKRKSWRGGGHISKTINLFKHKLLFTSRNFLTRFHYHHSHLDARHQSVHVTSQYLHTDRYIYMDK